jgi:hypothetical protein
VSALTGSAGGTAPGSDPAVGTGGQPISPAGGAVDSAIGGSGSSASFLNGPGWGGLASALRVLGLGRPPTLSAVTMLVGLTGAMTMAFAFAIFGKKRRDEQPPAPDEVLHANAARVHGDVPGGEVVTGVNGAPVGPRPIDAEAAMPRWRRPSLIEARKADPAAYVGAERLSFDGGSVGGADGHERRAIRYRVVRLLDAPDELRSSEIGQLDQGDEVQLLERSGSYWLVLCPDGQQGWLHKMTLGAVVTDNAAADPWNGDVEEDLLTAFLTARSRA